MSGSVLTIIILLSVSAPVAHGNITGRKGAKKGGFMKISTSELHGDLQQAMSEALGLDHDVQFVQRDKIEQWLRPTFKALPKNAQGLVELQVMEHAIHRYFMQRYSLSLKPFEPHRPVNESELRSSQVLGERAPAFVEEILKGRFYHNGFTLEDAVSMIATLEQFLYDDSERRLRKAYEIRGSSEDADIHMDEAVAAITVFISLIDGEGEQNILFEERLNFQQRQDIEGELMRIMYKRQKSGRGKNFLSERFTFKEVAHASHSVVLSASQLFADCDGLRKHMVSFDKRNTGRVKLSDLYWSDASLGFAFGESKEWLRRMGVLDESSTWMGPQVIIPNYIQAASNCVMTTSLFRQCCTNPKCQTTLSDLESSMGKAAVPAEEIWSETMIENMHDSDMMENKESLKVLKEKLGHISENHGGDVPIHGRLFAQWLHYLQPQECPYPYKRGQVEVVTQKDCGGDCVVDAKKQAEVEQKLAGAKSAVGAADQQTQEWAQQGEWLGQWTLDEELITDRTVESVDNFFSDSIRRATAMSKAVLVAAVFFCLSGFAILKIAPALLITRSTPSKQETVTWSPQASWNQKSHMV